MTLKPPPRGGHALKVTPPKLPTGPPKPGSAGWKSYTEARWNKNHPYAGQEGVDPITGEPKMQSAASIRAKANADAWKSIQQMQDALPDENRLNAQYGGQRQDISNLVSAHRAWLEKAGEYQVSMANGLAQAAGTAATAGDATAGAGAAAAGAPMGSAPATNVSPGGVSTPVDVYGTSAANYLHSLVPYATDQGSAAMQKVNASQDQTMSDLRDARAKLAAQLPELQTSNFKDRYSLALDQYKSELAALAQGQKGGIDAAKFAETQRSHRANELTAARNATTSALRAKSMMSANADKDKGLTASERTSLQSFFTKAADIYNTKGGTKAPGLWTVTIHMKHPVLPGAPKIPTEDKVFTQPTLEGVRKQRDAYIKAHPGEALGPIPAGTWSQTESAHPVTNSTVTTGKKGEATRRLAAWRYLLAQNRNLGAHALSEAELRTRFRQMFGAPA